jgi:hypothetical protein
LTNISGNNSFAKIIFQEIGEGKKMVYRCIFAQKQPKSASVTTIKSGNTSKNSSKAHRALCLQQANIKIGTTPHGDMFVERHDYETQPPAGRHVCRKDKDYDYGAHRGGMYIKECTKFTSPLQRYFLKA